jgi:UDP-N-acetylglucosamine:LPS N-acetylglucosamine transferase
MNCLEANSLIKRFGKLDNKKELKICLAASGGGHLTELLRLSDCWKGLDTFFVTTVPLVKDDLQATGNIYVVGECNRQHPILVLKVFLKCIKIAFKERPEVVISTGAAAGCMICFLAKIFGARIIWIDSITNITRISLSGRMVKQIADLFLVQWPELVVKYNGVEYIGAVI